MGIRRGSMTIITSGLTRRRKGTIATVLLAVTIPLTACGGGSSGSSTSTPAPSGAATTPVAGAAAGVSTSNAPATMTPPGSKPEGKLDCQAIVNAAFDLNNSEPVLVMLTSPGGGSAVNRVDSPMYVDTAKLRADLDVLAA